MSPLSFCPSPSSVVVAPALPPFPIGSSLHWTLGFFVYLLLGGLKRKSPALVPDFPLFSRLARGPLFFFFFSPSKLLLQKPCYLFSSRSWLRPFCYLGFFACFFHSSVTPSPLGVVRLFFFFSGLLPPSFDVKFSKAFLPKFTFLPPPTMITAKETPRKTYVSGLSAPSAWGHLFFARDFRFFNPPCPLSPIVLQNPDSPFVPLIA